MNAADTIEHDFFVSRREGTQTLYLKKPSREKPNATRWTINRARAARFGSKPVATAAAADINQDSTIAAAVEAE